MAGGDARRRRRVVGGVVPCSRSLRARARFRSREASSSGSASIDPEVLRAGFGRDGWSFFIDSPLSGARPLHVAVQP